MQIVENMPVACMKMVKLHRQCATKVLVAATLGVGMGLFAGEPGYGTAFGATTMPTTKTNTKEPGSPASSLLSLAEEALAGRVEAVRAALYVDRDEFTDMLDLVAEVAVAQAKFEQAVATWFGEDKAGYFFPTPSCARAAAADAGFTKPGATDHAIKLAGGGRERLIRMWQANDVWRVPSSVVVDPIPGNDLAAEIPRRLHELAIVFDSAAGDIRNGHFQSAADAIATVAERADAARRGQNNQ
jgi:hypothetical protein